MKISCAERERLTILAEECSEIIQVVAKILRHGWTPVKNEIRYDNRTDLEKEIGHVQNILRMMIENGDLNPSSIIKFQNIKHVDIQQYLYYQEL